MANSHHFLKIWGNSFALVLQSKSAVGGSVFSSLDESTAEMSRYYVRSVFHGAGIIQARVSRIMTEAAAVGHFRRVAHTMPNWSPARALYYVLGYEPIPAYAHDIYIARA